MGRFAKLHIMCDNPNCEDLHQSYLPTYRVYNMRDIGGGAFLSADEIIIAELRREGWTSLGENIFAPNAPRKNNYAR